MPLLRSVLHFVWVIVTIVPWSLALIGISFFIPRTPLWWFAVAWFRLVVWGARVILGIRVQVIGQENLAHPAVVHSAVLLSKHQSAFETLLLPTVIPHPLAYVFKRELLRVPFFGWCMARLDMVHIDRESRAAAMKHVIDQGRRLLGQGTWILLFPEGTRIARGAKGTYQSAGARLALETGVPVLPIAVTSGRCWPRTGFVKHAGLVQVSIGVPIASAGRDPRELMREVELWIENEMQRLDPEAYPPAAVHP